MPTSVWRLGWTMSAVCSERRKRDNIGWDLNSLCVFNWLFQWSLFVVNNETSWGHSSLFLIQSVVNQPWKQRQLSDQDMVTLLRASWQSLFLSSVPLLLSHSLYIQCLAVTETFALIVCESRRIPGIIKVWCSEHIIHFVSHRFSLWSLALLLF